MASMWQSRTSTQTLRVSLMLVSRFFNVCIVSCFDHVGNGHIFHEPIQYILMPSTSILCRLSAVPQARNNDIEMHSEDLRIHNTLDESSRQLEAAMKLFAKWEKGKAAQEVGLNEEDEE
jgi:hypothetical protein